MGRAHLGQLTEASMMDALFLIGVPLRPRKAGDRLWAAKGSPGL